MSIPGTPEPEDVLRGQSISPITPGEPKIPTRERPFRSYMEGGKPNPLLESGKTPQISPFDLAHGKVPASGPTFHTLQEQAKIASSQLGDVATQLKTPKLKLKQSTKYLLKNKLKAANAHIMSASTKLGAKELAEGELPKGAGPIQRFLNLVTSGQNQLQEAQNMMSNLASKGQEISPGDMLLIQIKLSKAQQQIQFSSMLLGKAMDDLKLMMNIQL
jgi:hypothetical protein